MQATELVALLAPPYDAKYGRIRRRRYQIYHPACPYHSVLSTTLCTTEQNLCLGGGEMNPGSSAVAQYLCKRRSYRARVDLRCLLIPLFQRHHALGTVLVRLFRRRRRLSNTIRVDRERFPHDLSRPQDRISETPLFGSPAIYFYFFNFLCVCVL